MRRAGFIVKNLLYYRRAHAALLAGVVVGTAVLTGALLVGDSVRESLRATALGRLGRVTSAMAAPRFFREELAAEVGRVLKRGGPRSESKHERTPDETPRQASAQGHEEKKDSPDQEFIPAILARGGATNADTQARADHIHILGVSAAFWRVVPSVDEILAGTGSDDRSSPGAVERTATMLELLASDEWFTGRMVILNDLLANELGAKRGDDVLLRLGSADPVPTETLLGRRDERSVTLRLRIAAVLPAKGAGAFGLDARQAAPRNAFVPLATLQRALSQEGRANAILAAGADSIDSDGGDALTALLQGALRDVATLADLGLTLRHDELRSYYALESDALLIDPSVEETVLRKGTSCELTPTPVLTYLANQIRIAPREGDPGGDARPGIPYSTVTAVDLSRALFGRPVVLADGSLAPPLGDHDVFLNQWAADDLGAKVGDAIDVAYYVTDALGALRTESSRFTLRGVLPMNASIADADWTPPYKGITDTTSLAEWNPPFPIDLKKVRPKDDEYWKQYKAAPKAFVSLATGRRLWAQSGDRFGASTAIRFVDTRAQGRGSPSLACLEEALRKKLDVAAMGLRFLPIRADALRAARGSTDFGLLFIGFSFFLVASAAMLMALLFRLGVERRAGDIGLLLAAGFAPRPVHRLVAAEGAVVALVGSALGVGAAAGYAWAMLTGLNSWWSAAVSGTALELHVPASTLTVGGAAGVIVATLAQAWSIRGLTQRPPRALLAGQLEVARAAYSEGRGLSPGSDGEETISRPDARGPQGRPSRPRTPAVVITLALVSAVSLALAPSVSRDVPATFAFFGSGASLLVVAIALVGRWLGRRPAVLHRPGPAAPWRLGARNAPRHRGRSLLTAGLIASATFLIASLQAFQLRPPADPADRSSGTGGFTIVAESAVPLPYDLNSPEGRESLGLSRQAAHLPEDATVFALRLRPGEESSCLNLYRPSRPRVLGASDALIERGGFAFSSSLARTPQEKANPWLLLRQPRMDGTIPVIADEAAVLWQLHSGLGKDITLLDERGRERRLRFVALLSQSSLQDEWIVSDAAFQDLFPSVGGTAFFLIDAPAARAEQVALTLEKELNHYSFDAISSHDRLARYVSVQNTYLATFQTLGGLGLVLGSCGLAVVLLRNVWERRAELALMRALGFSRASLGVVVLAENTAVVVLGLTAGILPALLAVAPHLLRQPESIGWTRLALTIVGVLAAGIGVGAVALRPTLRAPLLRALRSE